MQDISNVSWPGWEVVRLIGRGSFGAVYEIERNVFGESEKAALKVITIPQNEEDIDDLRNEGFDDASITQRFQSYLKDIVQEYSLMAKMRGHTNVVYCDDVRYVQHDDGIGWDIYIKMELLTPLTKILRQDMTEQQIIRIGMDLCCALMLCKDRNIVHRDIKPQNIFVSEDGNYKLGDFGIAKTAERTTSGTKVGTYKFMAPEVYNNQPYGAAADIYSLGLVMHWLLNDRRSPFLPLPPQVPTASEEDVARRRRFDGEEIPAPAHGSAELKTIVLKACAYDPKDRFASAQEMYEALESLGTVKKAECIAVSIQPEEIKSSEEEAADHNELTDEETETVGVFDRGKEDGQTTETKDDKTIVEESDETIGVFGQKKTDTSIEEDTPEGKGAQPKKKNRLLPVIIAGILVIVALVAGLLIKSNQTKKPFAMPEVVGMNIEDAKKLLEEGKIEIEIKSDFDENVEEGKVISQSVEAKTEVTKRTKVVLVVCDYKGTAVIADVVGLTKDKAQKTLKDLGFEIKTEEKFSDSIEKGKIIKQSIIAKSRKKTGETITLTVSKGKKPVDTEVVDTEPTNNKSNNTQKKETTKTYKLQYRWRTYKENGDWDCESYREAEETRDRECPNADIITTSDGNYRFRYGYSGWTSWSTTSVAENSFYNQTFIKLDSNASVWYWLEETGGHCVEVDFSDGSCDIKCGPGTDGTYAFMTTFEENGTFDGTWICYEIQVEMQ